MTIGELFSEYLQSKHGTDQGKMVEELLDLAVANRANNKEFQAWLTQKEAAIKASQTPEAIEAVKITHEQKLADALTTVTEAKVTASK